MSEAFRKTVAHLPELLTRNARVMILRTVNAAQAAIAADPELGAASYCALVLKISGDELIGEFERRVADSMRALNRDPNGAGTSALGLGLGLTIEPLDDGTDLGALAFPESTSHFEHLCRRAASLGLVGLEAYGKGAFITPLEDALKKVKLDPAEAGRIRHFLMLALDHEVARLYERLGAL